jgi:ribosome recycling factor
VNESVNELKKHMEKALEHLKTEFSKLRVGRATVSMIDNVRVEVYGSAMTLKEVAALATPDARSITIQPWDRGVIPDIERGIMAANLGLTPINDGKLIRVNLPPLTEDRRKDFVKQVKKFGEDAKVTVRNQRRDAMDGLKAKKDKSEISEDESRRMQEEIQKQTDHFIQEIDKLVESKSKEILTL